MGSVFLGLGSNEGDRFGYLRFALEKIQAEIGQIQDVSSIYQTAAWGFESETDFLNQVVRIETKFSPEQVLESCQKIEIQAGRKSKSSNMQYANRTLDIDVLFFDDKVIDTPVMKLPHPQIEIRNFVLMPLVEIAPDFIHPISNKTLKRLLDDSKDTLNVQKIELPN